MNHPTLPPMRDIIGLLSDSYYRIFIFYPKGSRRHPTVAPPAPDPYSAEAARGTGPMPSRAGGVGDLVQHFPEGRHQLADLLVGDHEGRGDDDGIADRPRDEPARVGRLHDTLADLVLQREGLLAGPVCHDFERAKEAHVPHLADEGVVLEVLQRRFEGGRQLP